MIPQQQVQQIPQQVQQIPMQQQMPTIPQTTSHLITIGNTYKQLQNSLYEWCLFVQCDMVVIKEVTFFLHETFQPNVIRVTEFPFKIKRQGWGTFEVRISVTFNDCSIREFVHELSFTSAVRNTYTVEVENPTRTEIFPVVTLNHRSWLRQGGSSPIISDMKTNTIPDSEIPFVDWSIWNKGEDNKKEIGKQIVNAVTKFGFFQIKNHGISQKLISETMDHVRHFFNKSKLHKEKLQSIATIERNRNYPMMKTARGYSEMREERLNPFLGADLKESFDFGLAIDGGLSENTHIGLNRWPEEGNNSDLAKKGFKKQSLKYLKEVYLLASNIAKAICLGLNLPENALDEFFYKPLVVNRYLKYPPQKSIPHQPTEMGAGSHVDFGAITLIYQEIPGLEILDDYTDSKKPEWKSVAAFPDTFVVNTGYMLEKLTNGVIRATKHRVINRQTTNRFSFALFLDPNPDSKIHPLSHFISLDNPRHFDECIAGHKGVKFFPRYQE